MKLLCCFFIKSRSRKRRQQREGSESEVSGQSTPETDNASYSGRQLGLAQGSPSRQRSFSEDRKAIAYVELTKKEGSGLGLVVSGGIDKTDRPRISYLRPGGIAHRSDALEINDYILSVNGIRTSQLKHEEIVNLLKNAGETVVLEVEYELPDLTTQSTFSVLCKRVEITLEKDGSSFGFTLRGGSHPEPQKCRPLTVTQIRPGSAADREATMKLGDRILTMNGMNVTQSSLSDAMTILKHAEHDITLLVEYDVSVMESVQNASGPLLIEIERVPGINLGITLANAVVKNRTVICIESIKPASIADRCGALHIGDQLLSIDDTSLEHMTVAESMQLLRCSAADHVRLETLPLVHHRGRTLVESAPRTPSSSMLPQSDSLLSSQSFQSFGSLQNYGSLPSPFSTLSRNNVKSAWARRDKDKKHSASSLTSTGLSSLMSSHQVCHTEITEVLVFADHKGFGFSIQGGVFATEPLMEPPVLSHIEPGGAAERTGVLQEGDRVLSINGRTLENRTIEEVHQILRDSGMKVNLEVEFDVAESVVPSSGVFNVKLAKKGAGIGITIQSPSHRKPGDPLIISDVKKGSVAHRTGTIQPGDKLLAVDNVRMDNCTIEDAAQVLQNSEDIVKLRIKKDESFAEEPDLNSSITYTVELQRFGGPLGITISGTEEPFDPVFISSLSEGGLADKTGALHIGDRILAINGVSLRGRPLSDAIHMLQNAGETVTLKITRPSGARNRGAKSGEFDKDDLDEKFGTPIPSVDSALESWDSSGLDSNNAQGKGSSTNKSPNDTGDEHCEQGNVSSDLLHIQWEGTPEEEAEVEEEKKPDKSVEYRGGTYNDIEDELNLSDEEIWDNNSVNSNDEDWSKTLEELDQISESDVVRQIEASIAAQQQGGGAKSEDQQIVEYNSDQEHSGSVSPSGSRIVAAEMHLKEVEEQLHNIFTPTPVELHKVTLYKYNDIDDFGFCLSDGVYEKGVYISAIRPGGPADKCGQLRPFDRVLQVNDVKVRDMDCYTVVPLIAQCGNVIDLVISRNPLADENGELVSPCKDGDDEVWVMHPDFQGQPV